MSEFEHMKEFDDKVYSRRSSAGCDDVK